MKKFGFNKKEAKNIYDGYVALYKTSIKWTKEKMKSAHENGYVVGAFNLRLKTPIMAQTLFNTTLSPSESSSEARSAGNMVSGQSYGLLTIRAFNEFLIKVRKHKKYRYKIAPWATIYDAIYVECDWDAEQIYWINKHLVKEMNSTKKVKELKHPIVKMETQLCIYYPSWANEIKIPNNASVEDIDKLLKELKCTH